MGVHHDNKITARKAISGLIDSLKAESDRIGADNPIPPHTLKQLIHDIAKLHEQAVIYSYLETLPAEVRHETVEKAEPVVEKVVVPEVKQPEPVVVPEMKKPEPIVEKVAVPEKTAGKPRPDIKTMIGFNEKLMFQRYLFAGDGAAYEEALKQINSAASAEEANAFISVLSGSYSWKPDSEPVQVFLSIVKRRFA